jgi:hypothetical protein
MIEHTSDNNPPLSNSIHKIAEVLHSLTQQARDIRLASEIRHHHPGWVTNNNNNNESMSQDKDSHHCSDTTIVLLLQQQLRQLENHVVAVEEQMKILTHTIDQEQRALHDISEGFISKTILQQRERILKCTSQQQIVGGCSYTITAAAAEASMELLNEEPKTEDISPFPEEEEPEEAKDWVSRRSISQAQETTICHAQQEDGQKQLRHIKQNVLTLHPAFANRKPEVTPMMNTSQPPPPPPSSSMTITPIHREEFDSIPRTTRGRISLFVVNDALHDIVNICRQKYETSKKTTDHSNSVWSTISVKENHNDNNNKNDDVSTCNRQQRHHPGWLDSPFSLPTLVLEQELRQSAAFFRFGESTARVILSILCSLGRLKQKPAKTGDVVYILT